MVTRRPRSPKDTPAAPAPSPIEEAAAAPADGATEPTRYEQHRAIAEATAPAAAPSDGAGLPAKRSKLAIAMDSVTHHMGEIERLGVTIAEVEASYPATFKFELSTVEGRKLADKVRADSRASRLHVQRMKKEGTDLLNGLKTELWAVADPQIARLQAIEDNAKGQLDAHAEKETARKQRHEDNIAAIGRVAEGAATLAAVQVQERIDSLHKLIVDDSYEEFQQRAVARWDEVLTVLKEAHTHAIHREEAQAAAAAEQAKDMAARARIAHYKGLPAQVEGTGAANIAAILATIPPTDDDEAAYGSLAEFVDMARDKALITLQALHKAALEAEAAPPVEVPTDDFPADLGPGPLPFEPTLEEFADAHSKAHADDDGPEVLAPQDTDEAGYTLGPVSDGGMDPRDRATHSLVHGPAGGAAPQVEEEDPFSVEAMQRAARATILNAPPAPAPAIAALGSIPAPRGRAAVPTPALQTAAAGAELYAAARRVRSAYVALSDAEAATLPGALRAALEELKRTLHV